MQGNLFAKKEKKVLSSSDEFDKLVESQSGGKQSSSKKGHSQDKTVNCKTKLSLGVTVKELTFQVNH